MNAPPAGRRAPALVAFIAHAPSCIPHAAEQPVLAGYLCWPLGSSAHESRDSGLSVLTPSERYHQTRGVRHKTVLDWARQLLMLLRRWLPDRQVVVVADGEFAALELLAVASQPTVNIAVVTRLRLDAALYDPCDGRLVHPRALSR